MITCTGQGDNGGHCCWINGKVCEFLDESGDIPRCSIWQEMPSEQWTNAPVGEWFAEKYPGYTCKDWPQRIPEAMAAGRGLCCWQSEG